MEKGKRFFDMSTIASTQASAPQVQQPHHYIKGLFLIAFGLFVGFLWVWGNAFSIMTSEAWITGAHASLTLSPQFGIFLQLSQLWSGKLSLIQSIAYAWGWFNQAISLIVAIGFEYALISPKRAKVFKWIAAGFVILNSLADLSFGNAFGGTWQPWAFAAVCCFATFALGVASLGLIVEGFKQIF